MSMMFTSTGRSAMAALAVGAVVISSCGGAEHHVQVPGASPVVTAVAPSDDLFTQATTTQPVVDVPPSIAGTTTDVTTIASTVAATIATNVGSTEATSRHDTSPHDTSRQEASGSEASTASSGGVAQVVAPSVTGWAAFDLHLMTILQAGSDAVSATVLRDGEVVHEVALGDRTATGDPVAVGDRYRVASISKVLTAITMLRLIEQGLIGIDDPVGARLASRVEVTAPSAGVDQITVRHLLTHRSGVAQYENLMFRRQVESCEQAGATGLARSLERAPGTTFRYSNLNFCLLGLLIEDITGRPYEEVVRTELLEPLDIAGMRLAGTFDVSDNDVEHRSDEGRNYMEVLGAAGSWIASPTEIATIVDSLDLSTSGWKPLGPELVAQMRAITQDPPPPPLTAEQSATTSSTLEPPPPPTPPTRGYGMGLMIFGPDSFGHTGTLESTHAMTTRQADGLTWAITVSGDHPSSSRDLAGIVAQALRYAGPVSL